jgi:hypothetical protein
VDESLKLQAHLLIQNLLGEEGAQYFRFSCKSEEGVSPIFSYRHTLDATRLSFDLLGQLYRFDFKEKKFIPLTDVERKDLLAHIKMLENPIQLFNLEKKYS